MTPVAKLTLLSTTPAANMPPVSTTRAENFATSSACVVDTNQCQQRRWQIATGINDSGDKFATGVNANNGNNIKLQTP
jgi:hypothetical protein